MAVKYGIKKFNEVFEKQGITVKPTKQERLDIYFEVQEEFRKEDAEQAIERVAETCEEKAYLTSRFDDIFKEATRTYSFSGTITFQDAIGIAIERIRSER